MIGFVIFTVGVWFAGVAFGATIFVDWLHVTRVKRASGVLNPPVDLTPSLPIARVVHTQPTCMRQRTIGNVVFGRPTRIAVMRENEVTRG